MYTHVNIELPRLLAVNAYVTTTAASTLYISGAPLASTNQTLANAYALWVDDGLVKFDGALTVGGDLTVTSDLVKFTSANADDPIVIIENTTADAQAARLQFRKHRGVDAVDGDNVGEIEFWGYDDGTPSEQLYGKVTVEVHDATSGQESGAMYLTVASHDGGTNAGIKLTGGSVNNEVDVEVGKGAASVTTVEGTLTMGSTATINNSGVIQVAAQTVIDHDQLANFAANEHYTQANITTVGTIGTGVWNATAIASAKMATASDSAQGAVELATTGEADTGTDTARAVTPAGLKSHVDASKFIGQLAVLRCNAFYVNDNPFVQNNLYFGNSIGNQPWSWNDPAAVGGVIGDTSSFTIAGDDENWGIVLPFNISKIDVQCSLRPQLGTGDDFTIAIYTGVRSNDSSADLTLTKVAHNSVALSSTGNRYNQNDVSVTADYNAGTMIYVGVGSEDNTDMKNGRGYMNITVTRR
jgi:hypothetical protein